MSNIRYRIRPNHSIVRLGLSKLLAKFVVKYVSTCTMGTLKDQRITYQMMLMRFFFFSFFFFFFFFFLCLLFSDFLYKISVVGTPLN